MPFMGQDWRAPGETWVKTTEGWEQMKLRPLRTFSDVSLDGKFGGRTQTDSESSSDGNFLIYPIDNNRNNASPSPVDFDTSDDSSDWLPHCFVKTSKSKEFVGCASMTEAFLKLDLARAVTDVQRFNYICKVAQIFVCEKLQHLSGSGRKILLSLIESIVIHCLTNFKELNNIRGLVCEFLTGLNGGQHYCGSRQLLNRHQDTVYNLFNLLTNIQFEAPADSNEDSTTFLDLPNECLRSILKQLPDHVSLLTAADADEALRFLVHAETNLWRQLVRFHFTQWQLDQTLTRIRRQNENFRQRAELLMAEQKENLIDKSRTNLLQNSPNSSQASLKSADRKTEFDDSMIDSNGEPISWRHLYFELKKYFGLKEVYADMIHICCHCKALFWKGLGHPCVGENAPSVRVTPQQFTEMLLYS